MCKYHFIDIPNRLFFLFDFIIVWLGGVGEEVAAYNIVFIFLSSPGMVPDTHKEGTKRCYLNLRQFHL